jgi:hypothetical protein
MIRIYCVLILCTSLVGCGGNSSSTSNQQNSDSRLEVRLVLKDKFGQTSDLFTQSEDIEFSLTLTNTSSEPITLKFSSGHQFDFYVYSTNDEIVWRWSEGMAFITAESPEFEIPAGGSIDANMTWDQTLLGGGTIPVGSYSAAGAFVGLSSADYTGLYDYKSERVSLTIQ